MKFSKLRLGMVVALLMLCIGLFFYQNVYVKKQEEANKANMYIAAENISAYTVLTEGMLQAVSVSGDSILSSYVLNKEEAIGKMVVGGVLRGEPITKQRLVTQKAEGEYVLRLEADSNNVIKVNDNVRVYAKLYNKTTQETKMTLLFENKKIQPLTEYEQNVVNANGVTILNILVTEKELEDYYIAKQRASILVVKIGELDVEEIAQEVDSFDPESKETQDSINQEAQEKLPEQATVLFTIQQVETAESMATLFKTTPEVIATLNEGKTTFEAGESVVVPSY